jgi:hypothetical protein
VYASAVVTGPIERIFAKISKPPGARSLHVPQPWRAAINDGARQEGQGVAGRSILGSRLGRSLALPASRYRSAPMHERIAVITQLDLVLRACVTTAVDKDGG